MREQFEQLKLKHSDYVTKWRVELGLWLAKNTGESETFNSIWRNDKGFIYWSAFQK